MKGAESFSSVFFLFLIPLCTLSQEVPNVVPPSPITAELNKYINFPVDHSTGLPEISIPLYVIRAKGLEIPIALNYHASGIRAGQDDGNVGVGWSLSCSYRVSRTIYGWADSKETAMPSNFETLLQGYNDAIDQYEGYLHVPSQQITPEIRTALQKYLDRDRFLSRFVSQHNFNMNMPPASGNNLDGEYDHFNYSIPGQCGSFIISDRINKTVSEFDPTNNKFSFLDSVASNNWTRGIIGFSIKDDNQNTYSFGEQVDKSGFDVLETNNGYYQGAAATAWALTDIDTKYGEKIKFEYTNRSVSSKYQMHTTINVTNCAASEPWQYSYDDERQSSQFSIFSLSEITTPHERIAFVEQSNSLTGTKLRQINIYDVSDNSLIKRIQLYFGSYYGTTASYVFLDSIAVFGGDLVSVEKYNLDYFERNLSSNVILVPDHWGYNKVETSLSRLIHNEFKTDPMDPPGETCDGILNTTLYNQYPHVFTERKENPHPEIFSLKSIAYQTGGKSVYEYEPNRISSGINQSKQWGGIRIKSITKFDDGIEQLKRIYKYGQNESGNGYAPFYFEAIDFRKEHTVFADGYPTYAKRAVTYSSNLQGDPPDPGSSTYYTYATEYISSPSGANSGKTVYKYTSIYQPSTRYPYAVEIINDDGNLMQYYGVAPKYVSNYAYWKKPVLSEKQYYSSGGTLLKKEVYKYFNKYYPTFKGLKVRPFARSEGAIDQYTPAYYFYISSFYNFGEYQIETAKIMLEEKKEVIYSGSDSISRVISYYYNSRNQMIRGVEEDSRHNIIDRLTVYPADRNYSGSVFARMVQTNNLSEVLEEEVSVNDVLISWTTNEYDELPGEIFVRNKIKAFNTTSQTREDAIIYHQFDDKGNVLSLAKASGPSTSYLWSYKGRYPVAAVTNAMQTDMAYAGFESDGKGNWTYGGATSADGTAPTGKRVYSLSGGSLSKGGLTASRAYLLAYWAKSASAAGISGGTATVMRTHNGWTQYQRVVSGVTSVTLSGSVAVDDVRLHPIEASMDSYTYDPLVGMTSHTDASGAVFHYEYDDAGRLKGIKDHSGNVVEEYKYNYRTP